MMMMNSLLTKAAQMWEEIKRLKEREVERDIEVAKLKEEVEKLKRREGEKILEDLWCSAGFEDGGIELAGFGRRKERSWCWKRGSRKGRQAG